MREDIMKISVNGVEVDQREVEAEFRRLKPHYDEHVRPGNDDASDDQLRAWATENIIERMLIRVAAEKEPPVPREDVEKTYSEIAGQAGNMPESKLKHEIELNIKAGNLVERVISRIPEIGEDDCKKWYREHLDQLQNPEMVRVRHIVSTSTV